MEKLLHIMGRTEITGGFEQNLQVTRRNEYYYIVFIFNILFFFFWEENLLAVGDLMVL